MFEQRLRWIGGGLGCFKGYYNIKELEGGVTTTVMAEAILLLKTLASFPS